MDKRTKKRSAARRTWGMRRASPPTQCPYAARWVRDLLIKLENVLQRFAPAGNGDDFAVVVDYEVRRSTRYNHFFGLALFALTATEYRSGCDTVRMAFRDTDIVQLVDRACRQCLEPDSRVNEALTAVLMPETDRQSAYCALKRVEPLLQGRAVCLGNAVYPEDGTDVESLLSRALAVSDQ